MVRMMVMVRMVFVDTAGSCRRIRCECGRSFEFGVGGEGEFGAWTG